MFDAKKHALICLDHDYIKTFDGSFKHAEKELKDPVKDVRLPN